MTRAEILQTAEQMVNGSRQEDYGEPEDNFAIIAKLWSAYCDHRFTAHDVAMMLLLMKVGRIKSGRCKPDSYVDGAGYISCAGEIAAKMVTFGERETIDELTIEDIAKFCAENNIDVDFLVKPKHAAAEE